MIKIDSKKFLNKVFETEKFADEDVVKFMLKDYFLKGYDIEDFRDDLMKKHKKGEDYAESLTDKFEDALERFSK